MQGQDDVASSLRTIQRDMDVAIRGRASSDAALLGGASTEVRSKVSVQQKTGESPASSLRSHRSLPDIVSQSFGGSPALNGGGCPSSEAVGMLARKQRTVSDSAICNMYTNPLRQDVPRRGYRKIVSL
mmetsp:Transcript_14729/g.34962  ORF Transcript_14729/g.34962 Transcript_14729/m.34962 type:complete len:128 (+) Transcript_14729:3-386(+)